MRSKPSAGATVHNEKKSRAPRAKGHYHAGNELISKVSQDEDRRVPSKPSAGPVPNVKKAATQGFAGHEKARGHAYQYSEVLDAHDNPGTAHAAAEVQIGGNVRNEKTVSSFGSKPYKA